MDSTTTVLTTMTVIFGVLWAVSEGLAEIPSIQANSTFQMIKGILKALLRK